MPPTNSGISPSQLNFSNIPNGGSSNLGRAVFAMNSPTRSTINANLTKMTDSPQSTPLSITSIMSISPLGHNRAARKAMVKAKKENDSMIYIEGPQVYTCSQCRTHLTSHDDIISKSFHGRHGMSYNLKNRFILLKEKSNSHYKSILNFFDQVGPTYLTSV